jgi:hypothetical protein
MLKWTPSAEAEVKVGAGAAVSAGAGAEAEAAAVAVAEVTVAAAAAATATAGVAAAAFPALDPGLDHQGQWDDRREATCASINTTTTNSNSILVDMVLQVGQVADILTLGFNKDTQDIKEVVV